MMQVTAKLNDLHIAPRKVRLVSDAIKGLSVNEAEAQLIFRPQRAGGPILKLLRSAIANAKHNNKLNPEKLVIKNIWVDQGPVFKRSLPRAMGRATPLLKRTSHVTLILEEKEAGKSSRFVIATSKKTKLPKKEKVAKEKTKQLRRSEEVGAPAKASGEKVGFFKKMFRRKSV